MASYLVLGKTFGSDGDLAGWDELGTYAGGSADQAVRTAAERHVDVVVFLAVPERSAKPLRVERTEVVQVRVKPETTSKPKPAAT